MLARRNAAKFTPQNDQKLDWPSFNGGWNNFFKPTELAPNELAQADNSMLIGKGTPTGRWGSHQYFMAGTGRVRTLDAYYNSNPPSNVRLAITDMGYLVKQSAASYSIIRCGPFASRHNYQSAQVGGHT